MQCDPQAFDEGPIGQDLIQIELGLMPWPSEDAKRHHFVPRFLLNRFAPATERIFQLDRRTGKPLGGIATSKAASRNRFYEFEDDTGSKSNVVEGMFAIVERAAAPALLRLEADGEVDEIDRATISMFLAFQWARTPTARKRAERVGEDLNNGMMASRYADREAFTTMVRQAEAEDADLRLTDEEAEKLRRDTLKHLRDGTASFVDPDGGLTTSILLSTSNSVAMTMFAAMEWTLLRANADAEFVTSDTGTACFDPTPQHPWSTHTVYSSPNAMTFFPISSGCCLVLMPGDPTVRTVEADKAEVMEANLRIYGWASSYIYGRSQESVTAVRRAAKSKPELAAPPRPHQQVILVERDPDDDRLASAHTARGWPPYMTVENESGAPEQLDYLVVGEDGNAVEVVLSADGLVRSRELKAAGLPPDSDVVPPGGVTTMPVSPGTVKPSLWW